MKKIIFAMDDYIEKKKAERAAENKAWREIHEARVKADKMGTDAAILVAEGWGDLEEACGITDETKSDAVSEGAVTKIAAGMSALEESCHAEQAAEDAAMALALAKGPDKNAKHTVNMHKYMAKPSSTRFAPYM